MNTATWTQSWWSSCGRLSEKFWGFPDRDQQPSPEEIAQFIFALGFSTAAVVTEVSGRGVGMDAVKSFVEREEGTIHLVFRSSDTSSSYRAFDTVISMPGKFAVQAIG